MMDDGRWMMDCGWWTMEYGWWMMDDGWWMDDGWRMMDTDDVTSVDSGLFSGKSHPTLSYTAFFETSIHLCEA